MTGALIILIVTIAVGVILWAWEKARGDKPLHHHHAPQHKSSDIADAPGEADATPGKNEGDATPEPVVCCGLHAICEKTGRINEPPIYYDDEELDRFSGKAPEDYSDDEIEEFRDILLTIMPSDAPGWAVSLEKRRIALPEVLKPELELLLSES